MIEIIVLILLGGLIWLLLRAYKSYITTKTKFKLGVAQQLNDGRIVETMNKDIVTQKELPFENPLGTYFLNYLVTRESGKELGNWQGLLSYYIFKWELAGNITTEFTSSFGVMVEPKKAPDVGDMHERTLYELLEASNFFKDLDFNGPQLIGWFKTALAHGEKLLVDTSDGAMDGKGRIRLTESGYQKSLDHGGFAKYWYTLTPGVFAAQNEKTQNQLLAGALLLEMYEDIENLTTKSTKPSFGLTVANKSWRF